MTATDHLSPTQFMGKFKPSEYGSSWPEVSSDPEFHQGMPHNELVASLSKHGMQEPVSVYKGYVVDGHHRVLAAKDANTKIHYEHAPFPMYEGQVPE